MTISGAAIWGYVEKALTIIVLPGVGWALWVHVEIQTLNFRLAESESKNSKLESDIASQNLKLAQLDSLQDYADTRTRVLATGERLTRVEEKIDSANVLLGYIRSDLAAIKGR